MNTKKTSTRTVEVAELYPSQGQWTEEDYFALPDSNRYVELSEGRLIMPPHPTLSHQTALQNIFLKLQAFVEERQMGVVRFAPLPVRLWPGKIREPDIFFIAQEHADRLGERACGVPDLAIEVISPATRRVDRVEKFVEYARAGVREYWLVDPEARSVEVYVHEEGAYILFEKSEVGEVAHSKILVAFQIDAQEVFKGLP